MWELDYKESWVLKNWCFWTPVLEKTLENPLDSKEIQPVHPKGDQSWVFIGRTDAEAETPILWPPDAKNWLIWKDPDAGKDWRQEENGTTEDEMVGWHHWLSGQWVWAESGSWWWTGRPGMLWFTGLQRVRQNWTTELNWTVLLGHKKARELQKTSTSFSLTTLKTLVCGSQKTKILKEMGIPDHHTYFLRNLYEVKKQQLELDMKQQTSSKSGKEYIKAIYCHLAYLSYMQSTTCEMPDWMKHKLESRFQGEISITLDMLPLWLSW